MLFNVRCVLFHFFHAIVKFCVVFVEEIILGAISVKYGRTSTETNQNNIQPPQYYWLTTSVTHPFLEAGLVCLFCLVYELLVDYDKSIMSLLQLTDNLSH